MNLTKRVLLSFSAFLPAVLWVFGYATNSNLLDELAFGILVNFYSPAEYLVELFVSPTYLDIDLVSIALILLWPSAIALVLYVTYVANRWIKVLSYSLFFSWLFGSIAFGLIAYQGSHSYVCATGMRSHK